jgi:hypothetical protein
LSQFGECRLDPFKSTPPSIADKKCRQFQGPSHWYGYIKEPYVTLIQTIVNPPAAVVRAGFLL